MDQTGAALAAFGLIREEARAAPELFKVFPENWEALGLWADLWPRWRVLVGMGGAVRQGLDLAQVQAAMALSGIKRKRRARLYRDLLLMEEEALEAMSE